jgi:hypothetical protein
MAYKVNDLLVTALPKASGLANACTDCSGCSGCSNCSGCSDCSGCSSATCVHTGSLFCDIAPDGRLILTVPDMERIRAYIDAHAGPSLAVAQTAEPASETEWQDLEARLSSALELVKMRRLST